MKRFASAMLVVTIILGNQVATGKDLLVEIKNIRPERVKYAGFVLDKDQKVQIEAVGFQAEGRKDHRVFLSNAWILDANTREIVWEMDEYYPQRERRHTIEIDEEVELPEGEYEIYYSAYPYSDKWNVESFGDLIHTVFDEIFDRNHWEEEYDSFKISVYGEGRSLSTEDVHELHERFLENAIVAMTALRDDRYEKQGFTLDRRMDLRIYAVGEITEDGTYDYGWLINADTRKKVWRMDYENTYHAGGAEKNRMAEEVISLPAGNYAVIFATDGSHSYRRWNQPPPYDALFWGITIHAEDSDMVSHARSYEFEEVPRENVIVDLSRLRDDEYRSQGFMLKKGMDVRIYAIGEGSGGDMHDYGWIEDARTHKKVWKMKYYDTEHAGGGSKNRLYDDVIHLDKGSYFVYFITDGSHSYRDWNTSHPFDPEGWGITILAANKSYDPDDVTDYEEEEDETVLAKIVRVRDGRYERERFTLDEDSDVHIYAIGEGSNGDMHDYGWIEDARGKVVWEMTYRKTEHAGGGRKNRVFNDNIFLRAGEYTIFFETDDSHSFKDWNTSPPHDQENWGITLHLAESK